MNQSTDPRFERKPQTATQAKAWSDGMMARLSDTPVTDNPHTSHVRHIWWRYGWLQADEDANWLAQREETLRKQVQTFD